MDAYNGLMDLGYTQNQIDEMDIVYHLELLGRRSQTKNKDENNEDDVIYFDEFVSTI